MSTAAAATTYAKASRQPVGRSICSTWRHTKFPGPEHVGSSIHCPSEARPCIPSPLLLVLVLTPLEKQGVRSDSVRLVLVHKRAVLRGISSGSVVPGIIACFLAMLDPLRPRGGGPDDVRISVPSSFAFTLLSITTITSARKTSHFDSHFSQARMLPLLCKTMARCHQL
jgi:hypothetical protein